MIRFHWKHIAITLAVLPVAAILFAWIGFFNVGASTGHWKITEWFLHFAMRSAIRTYALAIEPPGQLPQEGIQPAAGHFAHGCAICHGAPGEPRSATVVNMLPEPPYLADVVDEWTDAQLFRIVEHGVRFTGMPAWPTLDRDDEVWAMVAFLRELPSLDAEGYRALAYGEAGEEGPTPEPLAGALADCERCHGADGLGRSDLVPVIAGQSATYLFESLRAYAEDHRAGGIMALPATAAEPQWQALARHFAALPPAGGDEDAPADLVSEGREIARRGRPDADVPACLSCHGGIARNTIYPRLDGQKAAYIEGQLRLFRDGKRGGTAYAHLMRNVARNLSDADMKAVAAYFSSRDGKRD